MRCDFENKLFHPFGKRDVCASYLGVLRKDAIPYIFYEKICATNISAINNLVNRTFFSRSFFIRIVPRFVLYDKIWAMEIRIGVSKTARCSSDDSADTIDIIERPAGGGYSVVLSDGSVNGQDSKVVSFMTANKISALISEGVRDSTAIRATSDQLYTTYNGSAQALLYVISVDLVTDTIVISRNNPYPIYCYQRGKFIDWSNDSQPIGSSKHIQPSISEIAIEAGTIIVMVTDGVFKAGQEYGTEIDIPMLVQSMIDDDNATSAQEISDFILNQALLLDEAKPKNDMCVMVMRILDENSGCIRKFTYLLPIDDPLQ